MPLVKGYSKKAIGENIRRERRAGKSPKQAAAIAFRTAAKARRARKAKKRRRTTKRKS